MQYQIRDWIPPPANNLHRWQKIPEPSAPAGYHCDPARRPRQWQWTRQHYSGLRPLPPMPGCQTPESPRQHNKAVLHKRPDPRPGGGNPQHSSNSPFWKTQLTDNHLHAPHSPDQTPQGPAPVSARWTPQETCCALPYHGQNVPTHARHAPRSGESSRSPDQRQRIAYSPCQRQYCQAPPPYWRARPG